MGFAANLKRERKAADLTQEQLAHLCGWSSQGRIGNYEAGKREPSLHEISLLANALQVSVAALIADEGHFVRDGEPPRYGVPAGETPPGYVRFQLLEGAAGMGVGALNEDYPEVVRQVDLAEWEVRRKIGFLPPPGRIKLITGRGPSMRPRIDHGDVVLVDTSVTQFDGDATYVINVNGETQIKMLQMRGDGLYVVSANADYPAYKVQQGDELHVGGKVVATMGVREV